MLTNETQSPWLVKADWSARKRVFQPSFLHAAASEGARKGSKLMLATLPSISSMRRPSTWPVKPAAVALPVWTLKSQDLLAGVQEHRSVKMPP